MRKSGTGGDRFQPFMKMEKFSLKPNPISKKVVSLQPV